MADGASLSDEGLNARIIHAVTEGDPGQVALLYTEAADRAARVGDTDRECFLLTHAWIFALEADAGTAEMLHARLVAHGRDTRSEDLRSHRN